MLQTLTQTALLQGVKSLNSLIQFLKVVYNVKDGDANAPRLFIMLLYVLLSTPVT